ncbi:MAG: sigma-70 family RNA polymerase sigma factor [Verrucomicrobiota bacterium]
MSTLPLSALFAPSDEQAMWRVAMQGDAQAFAQLMRRWETPIQRLGARMTGDFQRGQDLAQETFARLFARRKEYMPSGKFSTYLWRIALNLCYDELRRIERRGELSLDSAETEATAAWEALGTAASAPDALLLEEERAALVRDALLRIAEPYRTVVALRHYENLKFREIAKILDIPEGTVKSRMAEALTQLSRLLSPALKEKPNLCKTPTKKIEETMML